MDGDTRFRPPHPGEYLREDVIPALGITVKDLAKHLGVGRAALSDLVHEKKGVSTEMAIRLGQAFRNGARFWLALQMKYDLWNELEKTEVHVEPLDWNDGEAA